MSEIDKCDYTGYFIIVYMMLLYIYVNAQAMLFISFYNQFNDQHNKWNNIVIFTKEYNKVV